MKKTKKKRRESPVQSRVSNLTLPEWLGWIILGLAVTFTLAVSWRKWPDPIVDFGRELYLPWQITQGGVLYRDIDAVFGPLSQYFNALVFTLLGPGIMHLVAVNLVIYAGILALLYYILRIGWGRTTAFVGSFIFITVFSFSQLVGIGNYTFAAPYAHETTHGFLLILALVATWAAWLRRPRVLLAGLAGLLWGLCLLLKIEIIFTASLVSFGAVIMAWITFRTRWWEVNPAPQLGALFIASIFPSAVATLVLLKTGKFTVGQAFYWANSSITGLLSHSGIVTDPAQASILGFSDFRANLTSLIISGVLSLSAFLGFAAAFCWVAKSLPKFLWVAGIGISFLALVASSHIPWLEVAKAFPIWLGATTLMLLWRTPPNQTAETRQIRWLLLLAALGLITRMAFNPRIYHYGFIQASLAGVLVTATAWSMIPDFFRLKTPARTTYLVFFTLFLGTGIWNIQSISSGIFAQKNQPLGTGSDQIFGFDQRIEPTTALLEDARKTLAAAPEFQRLLVIPEGVTLNYLLRKKTPSYAYIFHPFWLKSRDRIMAEINCSPPDYVLLISRDMREHSIQRFGESPEHGSQLLSWIDWNCSVVRHVGGDPLDVTQRGAVLFRSNSSK